MLSSDMLLPNLIPLIDVTFSTPTPVNNTYVVAIKSGRAVMTSWPANLALTNCSP
jgi:hypothetical protein